MIVALPLALVCAACERTEPAPPQSADAQRAARIVSLSPGVTATLVELGAAHLLVGRTPWCVGAPNVPAVGTLLDIDAEALVRASPTLVFVQPAAQGIPSTLVDLAQVKGWSVVPIQLVTLDDCRRAVKDVAAVCAPLCGDPQRGQMREDAARLGAAFDAATAPIAGASGKRILAVLCAEEDAELLAFGSDSYLMEALAAQGFTAAVPRAGYQALGLEDLLRIRPDIMILLGRGAADARFDSLLEGDTTILRLDEPALLQPGGGITLALGRLRARLASEVQPP